LRSADWAARDYSVKRSESAVTRCSRCATAEADTVPAVVPCSAIRVQANLMQTYWMADE